MSTAARPFFLILFALALSVPALSSAQSEAANKMCDAPSESSSPKLRYNPDKPSYPAIYTQVVNGQVDYIRNLWRKPCNDNFIKAYCAKENFCDGKQSGSQCYIDDEWADCAKPEQKVKETPGTDPAKQGPAASQTGTEPADVSQLKPDPSTTKSINDAFNPLDPNPLGPASSFEPKKADSADAIDKFLKDTEAGQTTQPNIVNTVKSGFKDIKDLISGESMMQPPPAGEDGEKKSWIQPNVTDPSTFSTKSEQSASAEDCGWWCSVKNKASNAWESTKSALGFAPKATDTESATIDAPDTDYSVADTKTPLPPDSVGAPPEPAEPTRSEQLANKIEALTQTESMQQLTTADQQLRRAMEAVDGSAETIYEKQQQIQTVAESVGARVNPDTGQIEFSRKVTQQEFNRLNDAINAYNADTDVKNHQVAANQYKAALENAKPDLANYRSAVAEYNEVTGNQRLTQQQYIDSMEAPQDMIAAQLRAQAEEASARASAMRLHQEEILKNTGVGTGFSVACPGVCRTVTENGVTMPRSDFVNTSDAAIVAAQSDAARLTRVADFFSSSDPLATKISEASLEGPRAQLVMHHLDEMLVARSQGTSMADSDAANPFEQVGPDHGALLATDKQATIERLVSGGELTTAERSFIYPSTMPTEAIDLQMRRDRMVNQNLSKVLPLVSIYDATRLSSSPTSQQLQQMAFMSPSQITELQVNAWGRAGFDTAVTAATFYTMTPGGARLFGSAINAVTPAFVSDAVASGLGTTWRGAEWAFPDASRTIGAWWDAGGVAGGAIVPRTSSVEFNPSFAAELDNFGSRAVSPYLQQEQAYFEQSIARGIAPETAELNAYQNLYSNIARSDIGGAARGAEILSTLEREMTVRGIETPTISTSRPTVTSIEPIEPLSQSQAPIVYEAPSAVPRSLPEVPSPSVSPRTPEFASEVPAPRFAEVPPEVPVFAPTQTQLQELTRPLVPVDVAPTATEITAIREYNRALDYYSTTQARVGNGLIDESSFLVRDARSQYLSASRELDAVGLAPRPAPLAATEASTDRIYRVGTGEILAERPPSYGIAVAEQSYQIVGGVSPASPLEAVPTTPIETQPLGPIETAITAEPFSTSPKQSFSMGPELFSPKSFADTPAVLTMERPIFRDSLSNLFDPNSLPVAGERAFLTQAEKRSIDFYSATEGTLADLRLKGISPTTPLYNSYSRQLVTARDELTAQGLTLNPLNGSIYKGESVAASPAPVVLPGQSPYFIVADVEPPAPLPAVPTFVVESAPLEDVTRDLMPFDPALAVRPVTREPLADLTRDLAPFDPTLAVQPVTSQSLDDLTRDLAPYDPTLAVRPVESAPLPDITPAPVEYDPTLLSPEDILVQPLPPSQTIPSALGPLERAWHSFADVFSVGEAVAEPLVLPATSPIEDIHFVTADDIFSGLGYVPAQTGNVAMYGTAGEGIRPGQFASDPYFTPSIQDAFANARNFTDNPSPRIIVVEVSRDTVSDLRAYRQLESLATDSRSVTNNVQSDYVQFPREWFDPQAKDLPLVNSIAGLSSRLDSLTMSYDAAARAAVENTAPTSRPIAFESTTLRPLSPDDRLRVLSATPQGENLLKQLDELLAKRDAAVTELAAEVVPESLPVGRAAPISIADVWKTIESYVGLGDVGSLPVARRVAPVALAIGISLAPVPAQGALIQDILTQSIAPARLVLPYTNESLIPPSDLERALGLLQQNVPQLADVNAPIVQQPSPAERLMKSVRDAVSAYRMPEDVVELYVHKLAIETIDLSQGTVSWANAKGIGQVTPSAVGQLKRPTTPQFVRDYINSKYGSINNAWALVNQGGSQGALASVDLGIGYVAYLYHYEGLRGEGILAGYNGGPRRGHRLANNPFDASGLHTLAGLPKETQNYIQTIRKNIALVRSGQPPVAQGGSVKTGPALSAFLAEFRSALTSPPPNLTLASAPRTTVVANVQVPLPVSRPTVAPTVVAESPEPLPSSFSGESISSTESLPVTPLADTPVVVAEEPSIPAAATPAVVAEASTLPSVVAQLNDEIRTLTNGKVSFASLERPSTDSGTTFVVKRVEAKFGGMSALPAQEEAAIFRAIRDELAKYPSEYWEKSKEMQVFASRTLQYTSTLGVSWGDLIWINVTRRFNPVTLHHELAHVNKELLPLVADWNKQLYAGKEVATYAEGEKAFNASEVIRIQGFVSQYAGVAADEDIAELIGVLFGHPQRAAEAAVYDPVLAKKIGLVKEAFAKVSGGKMDEAYWANLSPADPNYTFEPIKKSNFALTFFTNKQKIPGLYTSNEHIVADVGVPPNRPVTESVAVASAVQPEPLVVAAVPTAAQEVPVVVAELQEFATELTPAATSPVTPATSPTLMSVSSYIPDAPIAVRYAIQNSLYAPVPNIPTLQAKISVALRPREPVVVPGRAGAADATPPRAPLPPTPSESAVLANRSAVLIDPVVSSQAFVEFPRLPLSGQDAIMQEATIAKYLAQKEVLIAQYESHFGTKLVNPDLARLLFRDIGYTGTNLNAVQKVVADMTEELWRRALTQNPEEKVLLYTGSAGAGKSSAVEGILPDIHAEAAVILDGTLSSPAAAESRIRDALAAGKTVEVVNVYREPLDAWNNGVISRMNDPASIDTGRVVPVSAFIVGYKRSLDVIKSLLNAPREGVRVSLVDNSGGLGNARLMTQEEFLNIRYSKSTERAIRDSTLSMLERGTLTPEQYANITGSEAPLKLAATISEPIVPIEIEVSVAPATFVDDVPTVVRQQEGLKEVFQAPASPAHDFEAEAITRMESVTAEIKRVFEALPTPTNVAYDVPPVSKEETQAIARVEAVAAEIRTLIPESVPQSVALQMEENLLQQAVNDEIAAFERALTSLPDGFLATYEANLFKSVARINENARVIAETPLRLPPRVLANLETQLSETVSRLNDEAYAQRLLDSVRESPLGLPAPTGERSFVLVESPWAPTPNINRANPPQVIVLPAPEIPVPQWYAEWEAFTRDAEVGSLFHLQEIARAPAPRVGINAVPVIPRSDPLAQPTTGATQLELPLQGGQAAVPEAPLVQGPEPVQGDLFPEQQLELDLTESRAEEQLALPLDTPAQPLRVADEPIQQELPLEAPSQGTQLELPLEQPQKGLFARAWDRITGNTRVVETVPAGQNVVAQSPSQVPASPQVAQIIPVPPQSSSVIAQPTNTLPTSATEAQPKWWNFIGLARQTFGDRPPETTGGGGTPPPVTPSGGGTGGSGGSGGGGTPPGDGSSPSAGSEGSGWAKSIGSGTWKTAKFLCLGGWKRFAACTVVGGYGIYAPGSSDSESSPSQKNDPQSPAAAGQQIPAPGQQTAKPGEQPAKKPDPKNPVAGEKYDIPTYCIVNTDPVIVHTIPPGTPFPTNCRNGQEARPPIQRQPQSDPSPLPAPQSGVGGTKGIGSLLGSLMKAIGLGGNQAQSTSQPVAPTPSPASTPGSISTTTKPVVALVPNPKSVANGATTSLWWASIGTTECSVYAPGQILLGTGTSTGKATSTPISTTTPFSIACKARTGGSVYATTTVSLLER